MSDASRLLGVATMMALMDSDHARVQAEALAAITPTRKRQPDRKRIAAKRRAAESRKRNRSRK
jgi:hypothetical protein